MYVLMSACSCGKVMASCERSPFPQCLCTVACICLFMNTFTHIRSCIHTCMHVLLAIANARTRTRTHRQGTVAGAPTYMTQPGPIVLLQNQSADPYSRQQSPWSLLCVCVCVYSDDSNQPSLAMHRAVCTHS